MHSNWRALATINLPLKRFVREGENVDEEITAESQKVLHRNHLNGEEIREFYETIISEKEVLPSVNATRNVRDVVVPPVETKSRTEDLLSKAPFSEQKFFRFVMENNVDALRRMDYDLGQYDVCDFFGWTGLMMAAYEGSEETVKLLLELGADKEIRNKAGKTALELARMKNHHETVKLLEKKEEEMIEIDDDDEEHSRADEELIAFRCDLCQCMFYKTSYNQHITSTLHRFNRRTKSAGNQLSRFNVSGRNRGLQLMVKQGWDKHSGLGPSSSGRLYPLKTVIRKHRTGLGVEQASPRVTHFGAFDLRATKSSLPPHGTKKAQSRNDMRRERQREWKRERRLRQELS